VTFISIARKLLTVYLKIGDEIFSTCFRIFYVKKIDAIRLIYYYFIALFHEIITAVKLQVRPITCHGRQRRGFRGIIPFFFNLGSRWGGWLTSRLDYFAPEKRPGTLGIGG